MLECRTPRPQVVYPSRRELLRLGAAGLVGLGFPPARRAEAAKVKCEGDAADSCILLFLGGGPSHLDIWDMKPDAPAEIRGPYVPIRTSVPGTHLTEHLPRLAKRAHQYALIRSVQGCTSVHGPAAYVALTGHATVREPTRRPAADDQPALGSVIARRRAATAIPYVWLPFNPTDQGFPLSGLGGGWLGRAYDPWFILQDPNEDEFHVPGLMLGEGHGGRLAERRRLLEALDKGVGWLTAAPEMRAMADHQEKALSLLTSSAVRQAFRIDREAEAVREAYGRNTFGQSVLLARRLIEAGTRVVCVAYSGDINDNSKWDTHESHNNLREFLLPELDMALSSLIGELADRGRLGRTLVVVTGEFGRGPKAKGGGGRDHWHRCYTVLLAGGGTKGGLVYGSSDKIGATPSTNPVTAADVVATVYHCLGIPPTSTSPIAKAAPSDSYPRVGRF